MLSAALLLFANMLLFSLRISGGGSFPKPLTAAEEREWLEKYAQGDPEARQVLIERNLRLVAHIIKKGCSGRRDFVRKGTSRGSALTAGQVYRRLRFSRREDLAGVSKNPMAR